jgi:PhnB protein
MKLNPHLTFNGQCQAAFQFYERCLGGKIQFMLAYADSPLAEQVPPERRGNIVHATLSIGDSTLQGADVLPEQYEQPKGFYVLLHIDGPIETERMFQMLSENGTVQMPLQKTFWSVCFGVLVDQFGIPWELHCTQAN